MFEKVKRKTDTVAHRRFAIVLIGNIALTWLLWLLMMYFRYPPYSRVTEYALGTLAFLWFVSPLLWVFFALHHAQKYGLRWWSWFLVSVAMLNHYLVIIIILGNTGVSQVQLLILF
jgi:hypothetical protein